MTAFDDILKRLGDGWDYGPDGSQVDVAQESPGERIVKWTAFSIDPDIVDQDMLSDSIIEEIGVPMQSAPIIQETEGDFDDPWVDHTVMLGNMEGADSDCWALVMECSLMNDSNFESNASFMLMEGRRNIESFLARREEEDMRTGAEAAVQEILKQVKEDPKKILLMRQLMIEQGGGGLFSVWDSAATGKALDDTTPGVNGGGMKRRF